MGFLGYIGGILLCALAIPILFIGILVISGQLTIYSSSSAVPLGIGLFLVSLLMFAYGWYSYKSSKPQGTVIIKNK